MTCATCGHALVVGDFPFCKGNVLDHVPQAHGVIGDEIDETHLDLDPHGGVIRFRSRQERKRYLDAHQLQEFVRNAGPEDHHVPRWVTMDPQTLANAAALVARAGQGHGSDPEVTLNSFQSAVTPWKG